MKLTREASLERAVDLLINQLKETELAWHRRLNPVSAHRIGTENRAAVQYAEQARAMPKEAL